MDTDKLLGPSYYAAALQSRCDAVNNLSNREDARASMMRTIARLAVEVRATKQFIGPDTKLVVLPEYVLTAYPMGDTIPGWADKAALEIDGPEYEALGKIASDNGLYLAGNAYELDPNFPNMYFQASFILGPNGDTILRYRRLNSMFAPTPHDVWDKYLDIYGLEGVFPVADTEIGRLATIASEEILYPEIARCLAIRGAEVFLHSTGEMGSMSDTPKAIARKARALENLAYIVSANAAGIDGHDLPFSATDGRSSIVDYKGIVQAESGWGETMTAHACIDLNALRKHRRRPAMSNMLARQRLELFAESYAKLATQPANSLLNDNGSLKAPDRNHFIGAQMASIKKMEDDGII